MIITEEVSKQPKVSPEKKKLKESPESKKPKVKRKRIRKQVDKTSIDDDGFMGKLLENLIVDLPFQKTVILLFGYSCLEIFNKFLLKSFTIGL